MATVSERSPDLVLLLARRGYGSPRRLEALRAAVAARLADETGFAGPVVLGFAELAVPSVSDALDMFADRGRIRVLVVDLIVPADMSLRGWLPVRQSCPTCRAALPCDGEKWVANYWVELPPSFFCDECSDGGGGEVETMSVEYDQATGVRLRGKKPP